MVMSLKGKLFIFMSALFILFSTLVWFYSDFLFQSINEKWVERFIKRQVIFDKNRTLFPILQELSLVQEMAKEPDVIAMALNEDNPVIRKKGLAVLERYRLLFQDRSYFAAFVKTQHNYANDASERYTGHELRYTLSPSDNNDAWFFKILEGNEPFWVNVNKNMRLETTKVWMDVVLESGGKKIGVVGTGFDFERFLRESVGPEQEGIRNFFINKNFAVQLARDTTLIDYNGITKANGEHKTIDLLFSKNDTELIKKMINTLYRAPESVETLWVDFEGKKRLLGIAYLKEIGWFNLTLIDSDELMFIKNATVLPMLSLLFLASLLCVGLALNFLVLDPLSKLKVKMQRIQQGDYSVDLSSVGTAEIADLSEHFTQMINYVRANNVALEDRIKERTLGLMQSEAKLNTILDTVEAFIYIKDTQYRYIYANKKTSDLFGVPMEMLLGREDRDFFDEATALQIRKLDSEVIEYGRKVTREESNVSLLTGMTTTYLSTKMPLLNEDGSVYALCGISTDITERKKTEELIRELAYHDPLTHLPNRRMFDERFTFVLAHAKRHHTWGALLAIDLDNFKPLNDAFGHTAGDLLLIEVAGRLRSCIRESDVVARFGGDEFIVALGDLHENEFRAKEEAMKVASKILLHVSAPYVIVLDEEGNEKVITHQCTASIGVALFGYDKQDKQHIFSEADRAMYQAKQKGRNCIEFSKE